jgi:hypothetical protein
MPSSIREHYAALIAAGEIERDPAQEIVLAALAQLDNPARGAFGWRANPPRSAGCSAGRSR